MEFEHTLSMPRRYSTKVSKISSILLTTLVLASLCFLFCYHYQAKLDEHKNSLTLLKSPQVNDIYFLDSTLMSNELRPHEKYRLAKVADITGDTISLVYGTFFSPNKSAAINGLKYGHLSFADSFNPNRHDFNHKAIIELYKDDAIYLIKRPKHNRLYGHLVGPDKHILAESKYIYGKKENQQGEAFLTDSYNEQRFEAALHFFQLSAELGYTKGQVNLAQMFISNDAGFKDLNKALYWLKQAALQSDKPAIFKYGIVCKQVKNCNIHDFYQHLQRAGVNIKVRNIESVKLTP